MTREILVDGAKTFKIQVPDDAKITFGPWSPPSVKQTAVSQSQLTGTLRIYKGTSVIAVFSGVTGYRDLSMEYQEQVAKEEGATIWKSDKDGYKREEKVSRSHEWLDDTKLLK